MWRREKTEEGARSSPKPERAFTKFSKMRGCGPSYTPSTPHP